MKLSKAKSKGQSGASVLDQCEQCYMDKVSRIVIFVPYPVPWQKCVLVHWPARWCIDSVIFLVHDSSYSCGIDTILVICLFDNDPLMVNILLS